MHIESEDNFTIEEVPDDPHVAQLYDQNTPYDQMSQHIQKQDAHFNKLEHSQTSRHRDEVYSQRPMRKNRPIVRVVNKHEKHVKKNREKAYILMLENKVQVLEREIDKLKAVNRANQQYMRKISGSEQIYAGTFVGRRQIYERMESLIQQAQTEESRRDMIQEISTLRYRLGVHGKDRIKAINYYFKEILQAFIPEFQKFLIYTTCQNFDFFKASAVQKNPEDEKWRQELLNDMVITQEKRVLLEAYKPAIMQQKQKYDKLVQHLHETKQQLMKQAKNLERIFDSFRSFFNPFQLTKTLVNIERNKYRKEMTMDSIRRFWSYEFKDQHEELHESMFTSQFSDWARNDGGVVI